jgi:hypothetical protein
MACFWGQSTTIYPIASSKVQRRGSWSKFGISKWAPLIKQVVMPIERQYALALNDYDVQLLHPQTWRNLQVHIAFLHLNQRWYNHSYSTIKQMYK